MADMLGLLKSAKQELDYLRRQNELLSAQVRVVDVFAAQPARMLTDKQVEGLINSKHFSLKYVRKASDEVCLNWYRLGVRDCEIAHGITLK